MRGNGVSSLKRGNSLCDCVSGVQLKNVDSNEFFIRFIRWPPPVQYVEFRICG